MNNTEVFTTSSTSTVTESNMTAISNTTLSNLTQEERMLYLEYLDAKKWPYIYPVIIYLLILMVIGVIGNSLVFIAYLKRFKTGTTRLFIMTLATFDLLMCSLSIPGGIVELRYHYTFFFPALCRIVRASRLYFILASVFTLCIVAVDKFRKVYRPLKQQYTIRSARLSLLGSNIVALVLTPLAAVVSGNRTVETDREDVMGSNCYYGDEFITKIYIAVLFLVFIVSVSLLVVLYSLIGRKVWKHRSFSFQTKPTSSSTSDPQNATSSSEMQNQSTSTPNKYKVTEAEVSSGCSSGIENVTVIETSSSEISPPSAVSEFDKRNSLNEKQSKNKSNSANATKIKKQSVSGPPKRSISKTTFTLFIVTLVFIVSFLPFLIMMAMWGSNWNFVNELHGYTFTVYQILYYSYHINNVVNCYIYGFFNPKFREECKQMLCLRKPKKFPSCDPTIHSHPVIKRN